MISKKLTINEEEYRKFLKNLVVFTAPALGIFFYQLSQGVPPEEAKWIGVFALYGLLADYFTKLKKSR